jgi:hypothetical protein
VFDGQGHVIRNLTISKIPDDHERTTGAEYDDWDIYEIDFDAGLFGLTLNATLKNVGFEGANLTPASYAGPIPVWRAASTVGALAGSVYNSEIANCYSAGAVQAYYTAGGLCGYSIYSSFRDCYNAAAVSSYTGARDSAYGYRLPGLVSVAGGISGMAWFTPFENCHNTAPVKARSAGSNMVIAGGIVGDGFLHSYTTGGPPLTSLTDCSNAGAVDIDVFLTGSPTYGAAGYPYAGGVAGCASAITRCANTGAVTATSNYTLAYAGGLAAAAFYVTDSFNTGAVQSVTGSSGYAITCAGGIVADGSTFGSDIQRCYNSGSVHADGNTSYSGLSARYIAGGIVGRLRGVVADCATLTTDIDAESVRRLYTYESSIGAFTGEYIENSQGGLTWYGMGRAENCFAIPADVYYVSRTLGDAGLYTAIDEGEARSEWTYKGRLGWDFESTWTMSPYSAYPVLKWFATPAFTLTVTRGMDGHGFVEAAADDGAVEVITRDYQFRVRRGADVTLSFKPAEYNVVTSVTVDGVDVGRPATYTFSNVAADHDVAVEFLYVEPTPEPPATEAPVASDYAGGNAGGGGSGGGGGGGGGGGDAAESPAATAGATPTPKASATPAASASATPKPGASGGPGSEGEADSAVVEGDGDTSVDLDGAGFEVPKGAAPEGSVISLERLDGLPAPPPEGAELASGAFRVSTGTGGASGPDAGGGTLERPGTLTLAYDTSAVKDPADLAIYYYDEAAGAWVYVGGEVDPLAGTVSAPFGSTAPVAVFENFSIRRFTDIGQGHWAAAYVKRLAALGIVDGYPEDDGAYTDRSDGLITRAEFVKLIVASLRRPLAEGYDGSAFADWGETEGWAKPYLGAAVDAGIVNGSLDDGALNLNAARNVTRQEMIAMAVRALGVEVPEGAEAPGVGDVAEADGWARGDVAFAAANGLIDTDGGAARPLAAATRAEAAMTLFKLLEFLMY